MNLTKNQNHNTFLKTSIYVILTNKNNITVLINNNDYLKTVAKIIKKYIYF